MLINGSLEALPSLDVGTSKVQLLLQEPWAQTGNSPGSGFAMGELLAWLLAFLGFMAAVYSPSLPLPLGKFPSLAKEKCGILRPNGAQSCSRMERGKEIDKKWEKSFWPHAGICDGRESVLWVKDPELILADPRILGRPQHPNHSQREHKSPRSIQFMDQPFPHPRWPQPPPPSASSTNQCQDGAEAGRAP